MKEAEHSLSRSAGISRQAGETDSYVQFALEDMKRSIEYEKTFRSGWVDCFKPKEKILYRTALGKLFASFGHTQHFIHCAFR